MHRPLDTRSAEQGLPGALRGRRRDCACAIASGAKLAGTEAPARPASRGRAGANGATRGGAVCTPYAPVQGAGRRLDHCATSLSARQARPLWRNVPTAWARVYQSPGVLPALRTTVRQRMPRCACASVTRSVCNGGSVGTDGQCIWARGYQDRGSSHAIYAMNVAVGRIPLAAPAGALQPCWAIQRLACAPSIARGGRRARLRQVRNEVRGPQRRVPWSCPQR